MESIDTGARRDGPWHWMVLVVCVALAGLALHRRDPAVAATTREETVTAAAAGPDTAVAVLPQAHRGSAALRASVDPLPAQDTRPRSPAVRTRPDQTPAERELLTNDGSLLGERASKWLESKRYGDLIERLHADALVDPDVLALEREYAGVMRERIGAIDRGATLDAFGCGSHVCAIEVSGYGAIDEARFSTALIDSKVRPGAGTYVNVMGFARLDDGRWRYRMIFTTDPTSNALVVPESVVKNGHAEAPSPGGG